MLTRAVMAAAVVWSTAAIVWSTAACSSAPPSPSINEETTVAARWVADDGSVVAVNVVLGQDAHERRLPELARAFREQHADARVIVTFFPSGAGPERFVVGHIPTDGGPFVGPRPSSALATFDYPRPSSTATAGAP